MRKEREVLARNALGVNPIIICDWHQNAITTGVSALLALMRHSSTTRADVRFTGSPLPSFPVVGFTFPL
jgi:hypothetical protein